MTTLPMVTGLLPLALNLSEGGDMLQPMAVAAIGGLLMEIAVALFLMPAGYVMFTRATMVRQKTSEQQLLSST